jgi:CubicO group peptidase (beta-lactamase class C family)
MLLAALPLIVVSVATSVAAEAAPETRSSGASEAALSRRLDIAIDQALAEQRIVGVVVLVARHGEIVYHRAAGYADREATRVLREDDVFRLASVTKPIVSVAAMCLIERGRLHLDDAVSTYLPDFTPHLADGSKPRITIRQLLTHTAGLSYRFAQPADSVYHRLGISDGLDEARISLDENLRRLAAAPLLNAPGSQWHYSLAIDVLGAVVARVSGTSLQDAVKQLVTGPLAMKDTAFVAADPTRLVVPYADSQPVPARMHDGIEVTLPPEIGFNIRFAPSRALDPHAFPSGGAGMVGTAGDLLRLLETIRKGGDGLLKPITVAQMVRDQVGIQAQTQGPGWGFGYGWAVLDDPALAGTPQGKGTLQWGGAYGHSWFVDRTNALSVIALTNTAFEGMSGAFPTEIRNAVYGSASQ